MNPKIAKKAEAVEFGRALKDFGLNILVSDVATTVLFLEQVLQMKTHRSNRDFAVLESHRTYFQLHADHTYHSNPLPSLLPQTVGLASNLGFMILILTLVKRKPEHLIMSFCARVRIDLMDCENVTFSIRTVIAGCHLR